MRRPTAFSTFRAAFAGAIVLAAAVSCDTYTTSTMETPTDGVTRVRVHPVQVRLTPAQKDSIVAASLADSGSFNSMVPVGPVANVIGAPTSAAASVAACGSGAGSFVGYTKSQVPFAPEASPSVVPYPVADDDWIPDSDVPLGFTFNFQGQSYDKVNVSPNGFLLFGSVPATDPMNIANAGRIASVSVPNNIIALAWADWQDDMVPDPISWEKRGTAPHRRFVLQYNNVPEWDQANAPGAISSTAGRFTGQVVLYEGSNDIVIYTNQLATNAHVITQGIEDPTGTVANYDSVTILGVVRPRVRQFLRLRNDGVRFSQVLAGDKQSPTFTTPLPANDSVGNDPGANYATVAVGSPSVTDNCPGVTVAGTRSDGKPVDAPYPIGVTTITWTATDGAGNTSTVSQTVHVYDVEAPVWGSLPGGSLWVRNATGPNGAVVTFDNVPVTDNVGVTSRSCEPASGSTFPIGSTPVTCTASDAAGNSASVTLSVVVINAHEQIGNLIDWVESRNFPDGTVQPLVNQLRAAFDQSADGSAACKKMSDFMSMVQKKNSNISSGDAAYMLSEAGRIMAVMGCAPSRNSDVIIARLRGIN